MHDHLASKVALARTILSSVDRSSEETTVRTASLCLLLDTLIELAAQEPSPLPRQIQGSPRMTAEGARQTVAGLLVPFDAASHDPFREG